MQDFRQRRVWREAFDFAAETIRVLQRAPKGHAPLRTQLARSAASISANIAEGASQRSRAKYAHFLSVALGSMTEPHNHILLLSAVGALDAVASERLLARIDRLRPMLLRLER